MENKDSGDSNLEHVTVITLGNLREQFEFDEIRKDGEPIYIKKRDNKKYRDESTAILKKYNKGDKIMKQNYTHITVILDRSGSMESICDDTIGGFNAFLNQQKSEEGIATLTLVQFDSQDSYEVIHKFRALQVIPELTRKTFVPRGGTPLLDAIGRGINDLESSLAEIKDDAKPSGVVIVIITDGQENQSCEFTKEQIEKMIREKQDKDSWQFVFLSADMAAVDDALNSGVHAHSAMAFDKTSFGTSAAFNSISRSILNYRSGVSETVLFTEEDRSQQESETKRSSVPENKIINIKAAGKKRSPKSKKRPPESIESLLDLPSIKDLKGETDASDNFES